MEVINQLIHVITTTALLWLFVVVKPWRHLKPSQTVWVTGQDVGNLWQLTGVFTSEQEARANCQTALDHYFSVRTGADLRISADAAGEIICPRVRG